MTFVLTPWWVHILTCMGCRQEVATSVTAVWKTLVLCNFFKHHNLPFALEKCASTLNMFMWNDYFSWCSSNRGYQKTNSAFTAFSLCRKFALLWTEIFRYQTYPGVNFTAFQDVTESVSLVVMNLSCIRKILGSNLSQNTSYPDWGFHGSPQFL
jgi:hypothetical protein